VAYLQTVSSSRRRIDASGASASRLTPRTGLHPAKTRVDQAPLQAGTGIHPPPPGAPVTAARVGTQGAPSLLPREPSPSASRGETALGLERRLIVLRRLSGNAARRQRGDWSYRTPARRIRVMHREPLRSPARSSPTLTLTTPAPSTPSAKKIDSVRRGLEPGKCSPDKGEVNANEIGSRRVRHPDGAGIRKGQPRTEGEDG
jgi:hypothetical protein